MTESEKKRGDHVQFKNKSTINQEITNQFKTIIIIIIKFKELKPEHKYDKSTNTHPKTTNLKQTN